VKDATEAKWVLYVHISSSECSTES